MASLEDRDKADATGRPLPPQASAADEFANPTRTVPCASCHQTAATQRHSKRLLACAAAISSADSSTNTKPPEFANPTADGGRFDATWA